MLRAAQVVTGIQNAIRNLNPEDVRKTARLSFTLVLHANTPGMYERMENFFRDGKGSAVATPEKRAQISELVRRSGDGLAGLPVIRVYEKGIAQVDGSGFTFDTANPDQVICDILDKHENVQLSLARQVPAFRAEVSKRIIWQIAKENALFSIATAVPSIVPLISLPWAVGEFASDTAFLTGNQIRMAFMLAAANDRTIGYGQQKGELAGLFAGAFGWRAIARELIGKIPLGGGIIPKAAVSFAATYVVGASLDKFYSVGAGFDGLEKQRTYQQALEKGKAIAASLLNSYRAQRSS